MAIEHPDPTLQDPDVVLDLLAGKPCDHTTRCCRLHGTHVIPHRGCLLR